jgi:hypothetical protein
MSPEPSAVANAAARYACSGGSAAAAEDYASSSATTIFRMSSPTIVMLINLRAYYQCRIVTSMNGLV